jgi:transcriptional regulator with XRE-family HTH domain
MEKTLINSKIGKKLRQLRDQHNLTLDNLGIITQINLKTLSAYESGRISMPIDKLAQVLSAYSDVKVGMFLDEIVVEIREETK